MVENNTGLGEAISGGTRLSGEFGSPITRGLQLEQQNEWRQLQKEQMAQAKLQKQAEEMAKFATIDEGKWHSATRAKAFHEKAKMAIPKIYNLYKTGDKLGAAQAKSELINEMNIDKSFDLDEHNLNRVSPSSVTKKQAQEIYGKKGIDGLREENERNWYAPIASINEDGNFTVYESPDPRLDTKLTDALKRELSAIPKTAKVGNYLQLDKTTPEYKKAKEDVIMSVIGNDDLVNKIVYTKDFRNFYQDWKEKNQVDDTDRDPQIVDAALVDFVKQKSDVLETSFAKYVAPKKGGGSYNPSWYIGGENKTKLVFTPEGDKTILSYPDGKSAKPVLTGKQARTKDGKVVYETKTYEINEPEIKYLGNGEFEVMGKLKDGGEFESLDTPLIITEQQFDNAFGLSKAGKEAKIAGYKAKNGGGVSPKVSKWEKNKRK